MTTDTAPRYDPANPLAAIEGETINAHQALIDFWEMGADREKTKLAERYSGINRARDGQASGEQRPPTKSTNQKTARNQITTWASQHQWRERIQQAATNEAARVQEIMIERRAAVLVQQFEIGQRMIELGQEGLKQSQQFTRTTRRLVKGKNGEPDREIITVRMDARAVAQFSNDGIALLRSATGLDDKASGTPDDPIHTVTESRAEWEQRAAERASAAASTLAEFDDDDPPDTGQEPPARRPDGTE